MTGRGAGRIAAAALASVLLMPTSRTQAQDYDMSIGWGGGYLNFSPFIERGAATPTDIGIGGTWVALLQVEDWRLNRWLGMRLGGFYSHGTVSYPLADRRVSSYGADLSGLVRVMPPVETRTVQAYLIGGGGLMWFALGEDGPSPAPIAGSTVVYDQRDRRQWSLQGGGGVEVLPGWTAFDGRIGLRFEVVDQIALGRPFRPIDGPEPGMMHNLRFSVTLFSGVLRDF